VLVRLATDSAERAILLSVDDNGPGIPAKDIPQLFDRFFRVSRDERKATGLGLSICKTIVEAHNGTISCESTEGKGTEGQGTTMTVRFPLVQKFGQQKRTTRLCPIMEGESSRPI
jgi:signal transduction histidine kinase